jgi:cation diffusion facilitator CzcD-associated flavoprotein CzcO
MAGDKYYDVLVVGTGFSGLSALYYIKQLGLNLSIKGIESGSDVGGYVALSRYSRLC